MTRRLRHDLDQYLQWIADNDRAGLARAITLVESENSQHQALAERLLQQIAPSNAGYRVGITGSPGVGKSTFIEALGLYLIAEGHRVAVLAVDPSSKRSGGSILADKTRMGQLSNHDGAFIRPSPSAGLLGGVGLRTFESIRVCEAAGYDVILVETVGVGQSETLVAEMVDVFVALMQPGAGDALQGIKRGLMELVDVLVVNKADGESLNAARRAAREYKIGLSFIRPKYKGWQPPVIQASALQKTGISRVWDAVVQHHKLLGSDGRLATLREEQTVSRMWNLLDAHWHQFIRTDPDLDQKLRALEDRVRRCEASPFSAAREIVNHILGLPH